MSVPRRSVHVSEGWNDKLRIYVKGKLYDEFGPEPDPAYVVGVATDIADDSRVGRYSSNGRIYFPVEMKDEEILRRRNLIDENEKWFETNALDVVSRAKKAVAEALGE